MRGKARGADRGNEGRDQSGEGEKKTGSECVIKNENQLFRAKKLVFVPISPHYAMICN